ncbi:MAG: hypothetical protein HRT58_14565 [Crocinitomicaceae bacterium]|nr:hypothetical protein [Flavobacteriales bacterium]NQZ36890.1 hypothetical protein [Crocinitomicaceae bacterium]
MTEFRRIYCNTLEELPTLQAIKTELIEHDSIRIDYNINSKFRNSDILKEYIQSIRKELNVEVHKGEFKELEFYNIYNLFSDSVLKEVSDQLELAVKDYRLTSERLIKEFESKYDHNFIDPEKSIFTIREKLDADQNKLTKHWSYSFHGGDVCFSNFKTGQVVDINLKFDGYYGVLDLWFFQYFMKTTKEFTLLCDNFKDNTPKLIQTLNSLQEKGIVSLIQSEFFDSEKLIWNKEKSI